MLRGEERIKEISEKLKLPSFWVEYVIIEYFNCRRFFEGNEIWEFDFNLLQESDISKIPSLQLIIPASTMLYHNITPDVWRERVLKALVGEKLPPPERTDVVVEGLANEDAFPVAFNPPEVWDPKLNFSDYCMVVDKEKLYQWKISSFHPISGENRGWFKSEIPDLQDSLLQNLKVVNDKIQDLRNKKIQQKDANIDELRDAARAAYEELETSRRPIRQAVLQYHRSKVEAGR